MLCVLTTDAVAGAGGARRGAAGGLPGHLRPDRLRRLHVHQRHRAAAGQRRLRGRAEPGRADRGGHRGLPRPGPAARRRRRGRHQGGRHRGDRRRRARTTRSRWAGRWPATTWSRPRCSATTRTGAGSSPPSAPPPPPSSRTTLDVAVNGVWVCRAGAAAEDRSKVDLSGRDVTIRIDLHAGDAGRDHLDQRPVARVRARELGVLDMILTRDLSRGAAQGRHADRGAALAGPLPRRHRGGQVRRQRDDRPGVAAGLRRRHGLPALRRPQAGGGARRRPADLGDARPARHRQRVPRRPAGHHPRGDGRGPDGAGRPGRPGAGRPDQRARPVRGRPLRRGRPAVHRGAPPGVRRRRAGRRRPGRRRRPGERLRGRPT